MAAPKRKLPPALAANRWRPGQSGNPSGHSGEYGEAMKLARQAAPGAVRRLIELAELDQIDDQGNLTALSAEADRRVVMVASNALIERAFGKPREYDPAKDSEGPLLHHLKAQTAQQAGPLTLREIAAIEELAEARLEAIEARLAREESGDSDGPV